MIWAESLWSGRCHGSADEDEPFEPLVQATVYLCYLLMLLAVLSVAVTRPPRFAGG